MRDSIERVMSLNDNKHSLYDVFTVLSHGGKFSFDIDEVNIDLFSTWNMPEEEYRHRANLYKKEFERRKVTWKSLANFSGANMYETLKERYNYPNNVGENEKS